MIRLFFLAISDNYDGDSFSRILYARMVVDEGAWNPTEIWLPGHFWLLSIPYALGLEGQLWARLVTAVAGAATVPVLYSLVGQWSGRRAAMVAALVLALCPLHIRFSIVTVSEAFLVCFLAVGLWGYFRYLERGSIGFLFGGALAFNLASAHRPEPWLLLPILALAPLIPGLIGDSGQPRERRSRALLYAVLAGIFAAGWAARGWIVFGDPFYIASLNSGRVHADAVYGASMGWYTVAFWPAVLLATLGPLVLGWAVVGAVRSGLSRGARLPGALFFGFLALYYIQNARVAMITDARYAVLLTLLLLLSLGFASDRPALFSDVKRWGAAAAAWLVIVCVVAELNVGTVSDKLSSITARPRFDPVVHSVTDWLRHEGQETAIAFGPGLGRLGPWYLSLDDWRPPGEVPVVSSEPAMARYIQSIESGLIVMDLSSEPAVALLERKLVPSVDAEIVRTDGAIGVVRFSLPGQPMTASGSPARAG